MLCKPRVHVQFSQKKMWLFISSIWTQNLRRKITKNGRRIVQYKRMKFQRKARKCPLLFVDVKEHRQHLLNKRGARVHAFSLGPTFFILFLWLSERTLHISVWWSKFNFILTIFVLTTPSHVFPCALTWRWSSKSWFVSEWINYTHKQLTCSSYDEYSEFSNKIIYWYFIIFFYKLGK